MEDAALAQSSKKLCGFDAHLLLLQVAIADREPSLLAVKPAQPPSGWLTALDNFDARAFLEIEVDTVRLALCTPILPRHRDELRVRTAIGRSLR